jgi:hypothetical protein
MKKIIFIIIMIIVLRSTGSAQTAIVTRLVIPVKTNIFLSNNKTADPVFDHSAIKATLFEEPDNSLLFFNDLPLLKINKPVASPLSITTELSFSDVLENSMNSLKTGLVNTYDDHISELFKDAPSLFKVKCIISF